MEIEGDKRGRRKQEAEGDRGRQEGTEGDRGRQKETEGDRRRQKETGGNRETNFLVPLAAFTFVSPQDRQPRLLPASSL